MFMQWNNCDFHFISIKVVKIPIISHIWFKGFNKYMIFHSYSFFLLGTSIIWHGNNFYSNMLIFPLEVRVFYIFTSFKSSSNRFLCLSYGWISSRFIYFYSWNPHIYFCLFDILGLLNSGEQLLNDALIKYMELIIDSSIFCWFNKIACILKLNRMKVRKFCIYFTLRIFF